MEFKHLTKWTIPDSYAGKQWPEYYEILGHNRDSDILSQSNFQAMMDRLGGESETILINRCNHWACGWLETIMIHESDLKALAIADQVMKAYESYPVINESLYSEMENDSYSDYAESEQDSLSDFLIEVFAIPEQFKPETVELAYMLNMESQYQGGEYSAFDHNVYNFRSTNDFDTRDLESLLDSSDIKYNLSNGAGLIVDYINAVMGV